MTRSFIHRHYHNMDSDSDDDYFNRLCAAAPGDNDDEDGDLDTRNLKAPGMMELEQTSSLVGEMDDETKYFNALANSVTSQQSTSVVVDEESLVWQSLLRSASTGLPNNPNATSCKPSLAGCSKLILAESTSSMHLISQFLFSHLPLSSVCFCQLKSWMAAAAASSHHDSTSHCFVDHIQFPSLVLLITHKRQASVEDDLSVTMFSTLLLSFPILHEIGTLFKNMRKKRPFHEQTDVRPQRITLQGIDSWSCYEPFLNDIGKRGLGHIWAEPASLWVSTLLPPLPPIPLPPLPSPYYLSPLTLQDAETMNAHWKYRSEHSLHDIRSLISDTHLPSISCRHRNADGSEHLIGWAVTYNYGAIGLLHILDEHRGRGLAKHMVRSLLPLCAAAFECSPFAFITPDNDASRTVFRALGFQKMSDCHWAGLSWHDV